MAVIFESEFHKKYVGGEGEVVESPLKVESSKVVKGMSKEDLLAEYRKYVNDPKAELPEGLI